MFESRGSRLCLSVGAGLALVWAAAVPVLTAQDDTEDDVVVAIVQLRNHPGLLDETVLKEHIRKTFELEPGDEPAKGRFFVSGIEEDFVAAIDGVVFMVFDFGEPYFIDSETEMEAAKDPRLREAIRKNTAWLSVDLMQDKDDADAVAAGYRTIGKLQASLIDQNTLALYDARARVAVAWNLEYGQLLRSPKPLVVFAAGLLDFEATEARRKEWTTFLAAYANATEGERFYVQARIAGDPGKDPESRWFRILRLGAGSFDVASLVEPVDWANPREEGGAHKLEQGSVTDWKIPGKDGEDTPAVAPSD